MASLPPSTPPMFGLNDAITKESKAAKAFWEIFNDRFYKLVSDLPAVWKGSEDYKHEQAIIKHVARPFFFGGFASIVIFANFRLMANKSFQNKMRFRHSPVPKKKEKVDAPATQTKQSKRRQEQEEFKSSLSIEEESRKELIKKEIETFSGLPLDFMLSTIVGLSITSFLFTGRDNMDRNRNAFETIPLLPGKSLVAQYMCSDMINVHDRMPTTLWNEVDNDITLQSFRRFVRNCQIRNKEEQRIREQLLLSVDEEVLIPLPGITDQNPRTLKGVRNLFDFSDPLIFFNNSYKRVDDKKQEQGARMKDESNES